MLWENNPMGKATGKAEFQVVCVGHLATDWEVRGTPDNGI